MLFKENIITLCRYKLTIAYDGTAYSGWQVQPNGRAIQTLIQKALEIVLRGPVNLTGSSRTDAGVHARGQTAHFDSLQPKDPRRLRLSLNAMLPPDIRILQVDAVAPDFHARYSAVSKTYHYHLHLDPVIDPFVRFYRHQVLGRFELEKVKESLPQFLGTKDFCSFANEQSTKPRTTIRTLTRFDAIEQKGGVRLEIEGSGFLYKMVRNMVGVLLDVGSGKLESQDIPLIFSAKDRRAASSAAPPQALFLMEVLYKN